MANFLLLRIILAYFVLLIAKHALDNLQLVHHAVFLLLVTTYSFRIVFAGQTVQLAYIEILLIWLAQLACLLVLLVNSLPLLHATAARMLIIVEL